LAYPFITTHPSSTQVFSDRNFSDFRPIHARLTFTARLRDMRGLGRPVFLHSGRVIQAAVFRIFCCLAAGVSLNASDWAYFLMGFVSGHTFATKHEPYPLSLCEHFTGWDSLRLCDLQVAVLHPTSMRHIGANQSCSRSPSSSALLLIWATTPGFSAIAKPALSPRPHRHGETAKPRRESWGLSV